MEMNKRVTTISNWINFVVTIAAIVNIVLTLINYHSKSEMVPQWIFVPIAFGLFFILLVKKPLAKIIAEITEKKTENHF
jgi:uncharacterized membrane protein YdcZ (DUF606 family)